MLIIIFKKQYCLIKERFFFFIVKYTMEKHDNDDKIVKYSRLKLGIEDNCESFSKEKECV